MATLFSPILLRSIQLKNRIVVSPMCQYSSEDGFASDWHLVHLGSRAVGGAALVFTEATAVAPEGRISPGDLGIWKDEHIPELKRITAFIEQQGAVPGMQLAHAGRKASIEVSWKGGQALVPETGGWEIVAPSPLPFKEGDLVPLELTRDAISRLIDDFGKAAARALKAGFKVIELHAAHGYLIHEFLSPMSNHRTDEYGGSFHNRIRFLLEIIDRVREVWPETLPLFVRISATDWIENGWSENDSVELARVLLTKDVDLVDCSTGGNVPNVRIPLTPMYQVPFAEKIRRETGMKTGAVGLITTSNQAESVILDGKADLVFLARELLRDPYFPLRAQYEQGVEQHWPVQYERAKRK
jgi:2,4-dienoyl-CoA reductase-like NADH-dependent reductase (Old Yellow Enzyme family)